MAACEYAYVELHAHSAFSFLRAGSSVEALVARAAALGMPALALTDYMTLAGVVRFQAACAQYGLKGIVGCELAVADPVFGDAVAVTRPAHLVVLAEDAGGYARLCQLLTEANLSAPETPVVPFAALAATLAQPQPSQPSQPSQAVGLIVLTGGREGTLTRLLLAGQRQAAEEVAQRYRAVFGPEHVFVELQHQQREGDVRLQEQLVALAEQAELRCVLTNGVRYATRADYPPYDLLTCVRLGLSVDSAHPERPVNDEAYLADGHELARRGARLPWTAEALATSVEIAARCNLTLLRATCTAPRVPLAAEETPASRLRALCEQGLRARYTTGEPEAGTETAAAVGALEAEADTEEVAEIEMLREGSSEATGTTQATAATAATAAVGPRSTAAEARPQPVVWRQLEHELAVIGRLELEEFFLCVADIMRAAREMGIRVSGRGSAANSLVAYCLGITGVDPIRHGLLFERFLNPDRRGMPDIDIDVQSDRREELIRYVERTYTSAHAAMVANVITYRPRLALRDAAKALGYPLALVNQLTKVVAHHAGREALAGYATELAQVITTRLPSGPGGEEEEGKAVRARCLARLPLLLRMAAHLCGLPRHLSLHNGGMVLTREPLVRLLPVRVSANGVRALEVDKDDVERLGLIKFDLLGLRTLGAVEEALALIEETTGVRPDVDHLPMEPPDEMTMRLVRAGQTLAVFQIESPGQWHLLARTQPQTFDDLIVQTALFRPGPIQGGFVHPYIERRRHTQHLRAQQAQLAQQHPGQPEQRRQQRDAVQAPWRAGEREGVADDFWTGHAVLGPILHETEGILLFQEQILEIAHRFAGLSYAEADGFRRAMSHARHPEEMEAMRTRFVGGAVARGEQLAAAMRVFAAISHFVGYGFCKSHAAEFAKTIYATAWLKAHYPAHYLAAFLSAQPAGFFPPHVVLEEARLLGIPILPPDINRSADRFTVEAVGVMHRRWAIRIGLRQVAHVGDALAEAILWERQGRSVMPSTPSTTDTTAAHSWCPFASLADACTRLRPSGLTWSAAEALVLAGAFDGLHPGVERRRLLWHLHEIWPLTGGGGGRSRRTARSTITAAGTSAAPDRPRQLALDWQIGREWLERIPRLPALDREEHAALDYALLGLSPRPHPMRLRRRELRRAGVRAIAELAGMEAGRIVRVAGWPISAQRPPTAKGMGFVVLEDETGRLPVALPPQIAAQLHRVLREARVVVVRGRCERVRWYRSLLGFEIEAVVA